MQRPGWMEQAKSFLLNGLTGVGNVLDVPGSMVRDAIGGENPFDQLLSPWRGDNRLTGRDLARQWGLAGQEDTLGNMLGGVALEMAMDPLNIIPAAGLLRRAFQGRKIAKAARAADAANDASLALRAKGWMPEEVAAMTKIRKHGSDVPARLYHETSAPVFGARGFAADKGVGNLVGPGTYFSSEPGELLGTFARTENPRYGFALAANEAAQSAGDLSRGLPAPRTMMAFIDSRKPFVFNEAANMSDMLMARRALPQSGKEMLQSLKSIKGATGRPIRKEHLWAAMRDQGLSPESITSALKSAGFDAIQKDKFAASRMLEDMRKIGRPSPGLDFFSETIAFDPSQIYEPFIAPALRPRPEQLRPIPRSLMAAFAGHQAVTAPARVGRYAEQ